MTPIATNNAVVRALPQVRQLMHHDHLQERGGRLLEQARRADLALGLELVALHARHGGVGAQSVLDDVQLAVVGHLSDGLGIAQKLALQSG